MSKISLADVALALDAMLDGQMTAQARIVAHLVAAVEAAGRKPEQVIETLDALTAATVIDEFWITDGEGVVYLTSVKDDAGRPMPFRFNPDPAIQPQASAFHVLLASSVDSDNVVAQRAQVREIDNEIYKYVGVAGVDRQRIVQVGNALAFEEQALQSGVYTSPVMTAVLAAFSEPDLLSAAFTSQFDEIRPVFEGILGQQMIAQATLVEYFVAAAEAAAWSGDEIRARLRRIADSTAVGEIDVAALDGDVVYSSRGPAGARSVSDLPNAGDLGGVLYGSARIVDHPTAARAADGAMYKYATVVSPAAPRFSQVGWPIDDSSPVSPRFGESLPG